MKHKVTPELIRSSALQLRRMKISAARARILAPAVDALNSAALAAAEETDFNDEPAKFTSTLARLKAPGAHR